MTTSAFKRPSAQKKKQKKLCQVGCVTNTHIGIGEVVLESTKTKDSRRKVLVGLQFGANNPVYSCQAQTLTRKVASQRLNSVNSYWSPYTRPTARIPRATDLDTEFGNGM